MNNPRLPTQLPKEVLSKLDPRIIELYSQLPPALASRITQLVTLALPQRIRPDRVLKLAFLYATAEQRTWIEEASKTVSTEHTRRSRLELAGEIHGFVTGYDDEQEAARRYRRGRLARQRIKVSLEALLVRWQTFEQVVGKYRAELPAHIQPRFSDKTLREVGKVFQSLGIVTVLDEEDLTREQSHEREQSAIAQAYILWRLKMAPYRGKWNDMHQLAFAWRMSSTPSVKVFRNLVNHVSKGAVCDNPLGNSWDSILSETL